LAWVITATVLTGAEKPKNLNGFDVKNATVASEAIVDGGAGKDGIRSVDAPEFVSPEAATWVAADTPILGVFVEGQARAYPVHLLEYHQIVNDVLGGTPVVVTYDPLAGTPLVFRRTHEGKTLSFGVSGLLYNSNFLIYDRETESLWSQFTGQAISGPLVGTTLERIRVRQLTAAAWRDRHPESKTLARPDRYRIDYSHSRYSAYWIADRILFPVNARDSRYHPKRLVVGVVVNGKARAYLDSRVIDAGGMIEDSFDGRKIQIHYDPNAAVFAWEVPDDVEVTEAYWFAWKAFHPETSVWNEASH
jgi:hypothetical protein